MVRRFLKKKIFFSIDSLFVPFGFFLLGRNEPFSSFVLFPLFFSLLFLILSFSSSSSSPSPSP